MKITLYASLVIALMTFILFWGENTLFNTLIYAFILFISSWGLLEVFRHTYIWLKDSLKK